MTRFKIQINDVSKHKDMHNFNFSTVEKSSTHYCFKTAIGIAKFSNIKIIYNVPIEEGGEF